MSTDGHQQAMEHALAAETAVLGAIVVDDAYLPIAMGILKPEDFYSATHALLFAVVSAMYVEGLEVDLVTLHNYLRQHGQLDQIGGPAALGRLTDGIPNIMHVASHAKIVKRFAGYRKLAYEAERVMHAARNAEGEVEELTEAAVDKLLIANQYGRQVQDQNIDSMYAKWVMGRQTTNMLTTGYKLLDEHLEPGPGQVMFIAGKSGIGKTTIALNMADNILSVKPDARIAFYSCESNEERAVGRIMQILYGVSRKALYQRYEIGQLTTDTPAELREKYPNFRFYVRGGMSLEEVQGNLRMVEMLQWRAPADYVFIDHLGGLTQRLLSRHSESEATTRLAYQVQAFAVSGHALVVALVQLNKSGSIDEEVTEEMVRGSGEIKSVADHMLGIWRPHANDMDPLADSEIKVSIMKNREGARHPGLAFCWDGPTLRITEDTPEEMYIP